MVQSFLIQVDGQEYHLSNPDHQDDSSACPLCPHCCSQDCYNLAYCYSQYRVVQEENYKTGQAVGCNYRLVFYQRWVLVGCR